MKDKEKKKSNIKFDLELVIRITLVLTLIGIVISTVLVFTPPIGGDQTSELGLLTYNESEGIYKADEYPESVEYNQVTNLSETITLFVLLGNHNHKAMFYEVRLKIGLSSLLIDEETFGSNESTYWCVDHWISAVLDIDQQLGPSSETQFTFQFNEEIIDKLGMNPTGYKIIFELWEWNSQLADFQYSGVYIYLTSFMLILI
ncbi:MAG: hypothetical protein FK734_02440 [Asgard group archaeon]|nr:hypothetical protein [Asgard group archaeon]